MGKDKQVKTETKPEGAKGAKGAPVKGAPAPAPAPVAAKVEPPKEDKKGKKGKN